MGKWYHDPLLASSRRSQENINILTLASRCHHADDVVVQLFVITSFESLSYFFSFGPLCSHPCHQAHLTSSGMGVFVGHHTRFNHPKLKICKGESAILGDSRTVKTYIESECLWFVCLFLTKQEELWLLKKEEPQLMIECWWGRSYMDKGLWINGNCCKSRHWRKPVGWIKCS